MRLDESPIITNPLATLRLSRDLVQGLTPKEVFDFATITYRFLTKRLHPDHYQHHPQHPSRGGDAKQWTATEARLKAQWEQVDAAYKRIRDLDECARAMQAYPPMSAQEELTAARRVEQHYRSQAKSRAVDHVSFLAELFHPSLDTVRTCRPCTLHVANLEALLDGSEEDSARLVDLARSGKAPLEAFRELRVGASGEIDGESSKVLAASLRLDMSRHSPAEFFGLLRLAGLRMIDAAFMLTSGDSAAGAPANPGSPLRRYRLDHIDEKQFAWLTPLVSAQLHPSRENELVIAVTCRIGPDGTSRVFELAGAVLGIERESSRQKPAPKSRKGKR